MCLWLVHGRIKMIVILIMMHVPDLQWVLSRWTIGIVFEQINDAPGKIHRTFVSQQTIFNEQRNDQRDEFPFGILRLINYLRTTLTLLAFTMIPDVQKINIQ